MANGQLTDATILVIAGVIGLFAIAGIVLGVFVQIKKLRSDAATETEAKVAKATHEALREKATSDALLALKESVDNTHVLVRDLKNELVTRIETVECAKTDHVQRLTRLEESVKSAHKRIDDHRKIDHKLLEQDQESEYG